ncbi:MAG: hypothetical protein HW401_520 [Parcubacteria group bacterium]|nr:hypothetical protein [Parcubacteria group bacterium]
MAKFFIISLFFLSAMFPSLIYAEDYVGSGNPKDTNFQLVPCDGVKVKCDFNALMTLVNRVISFILYISIPLAAISFSYAGYLYISAAGDMNKIESAHGIFKSVLIGFIFIISAWLIVYAITNSLLGSDFKNSKSNLLRNGGNSGENIQDTGANYSAGNTNSDNINLQVVDDNPDLYTPPSSYGSDSSNPDLYTPPSSYGSDSSNPDSYTPPDTYNIDISGF